MITSHAKSLAVRRLSTGKLLTKTTINTVVQPKWPRKDHVISNNGRWAASIDQSDLQTTNLIDVSTGELAHKFPCPGRQTCAMAFSPDHTALAIASVRAADQTSTIQIWNLADHSPVFRSLLKVNGNVWSVAWNESSELIAAGTVDGRVETFNIETDTRLSNVKLGGQIVALAFVPGRYQHRAAADATTSRVTLIDAASGRRLTEPLLR